MSNLFTPGIGVNFSNTFMSNPISGATAAAKIAGEGIKWVKMFTYNQADVLDAAKANGLQVIVDVPNGDLAGFANGDVSPLINVVKAYPDTIPMVLVGNEPLGSWWNGQFEPHLVAALTNVRKGLADAGLSMKVSVPFNFAIMGASYPPSAGKLATTTAATVEAVCNIIKQDGSVFMINVYPFITHHQQPSNVPLDYCLFTAENDPQQWVTDGNYTYKNIFDAMYDALVVALGNVGYGDLEIVIGECGWPSGPTSTYPSATVTNAKTFNQNLISHCTSGNGTPRNPGIPINAFVFEQYDEDTKPTDAGTFERHWGVCDDSGTAKYDLAWEGN